MYRGQLTVELTAFEQLLRMMVCVSLPWGSGVNSHMSEQQHVMS